jgi:hypothetical protein
LLVKREDIFEVVAFVRFGHRLLVRVGVGLRNDDHLVLVHGGLKTQKHQKKLKKGTPGVKVGHPPITSKAHTETTQELTVASFPAAGALRTPSGELEALFEEDAFTFAMLIQKEKVF